MSFEGYYQTMCENGHYYEFDVYDAPRGQIDASSDERSVEGWCNSLVDGKPCNKPEAWSTLVDITNGAEDGRVELVLLKHPVYKTCDLGHNHLVSDEIFVIPGEAPLKTLTRHATMEDGD